MLAQRSHGITPLFRPAGRLIKLLGVLGSDHAGERDAAALAIERLRRSTGLTWAELLRPARARPAIIIPPWPVRVPILARGEVAADFAPVPEAESVGWEVTTRSFRCRG